MSSESPGTFGELLCSWRLRGGWTRGEIAQAAGVSGPFVAMLENGVRKPSDDTVERLIVALDLSPRTAGMFRRMAVAER